MAPSHNERDHDESPQGNQRRAENERPRRSYRDALVGATQPNGTIPDVGAASADDGSTDSQAATETSSGEGPRSRSGDEADPETTERLERPLHARQRATTGNENAWIPEGVPGPSRMPGVPQTTRDMGSDAESEASSDRQPPLQPPLPQLIRLYSPQDSAADVGFSSEGEYVRQEALRGGITGNLLTPSQVGTPVHETSASDSEGIMMRPSSRLSVRQDANAHPPNPVTRDFARGRSPQRTLGPQITDQDPSSSEASRYRQIERPSEEQRAVQRLRGYAVLGDDAARYLV